MHASANAKNLKNAISVLPQLTERKRTLDMHMNIATALFKIIGDRQLDTFTAIEESISKQVWCDEENNLFLVTNVPSLFTFL